MSFPAPRILRQLATIRENRAILFLALLLAIFLSLSLIVHSPDLLAVDRAVTSACQQLRWPGLDGLARGFTFMGNSGTVALLALVAAGFLWATGRPRAAFLCAMTLLGLPLNMWVKDVIGRPRPDGSAVAVLMPVIGLSFPSGHAMLSTLFYGFLALMTWVHCRRKKQRVLWTTLLAALALAISLSRIYMGAHWFSDVVGGCTAGLFLLLLLAELYRFTGSQELIPSDERNPRVLPE